MFEIVFFTALTFYFLQTVLFIIGVNKKFNRIADDDLPLVSVIVAARNEEENILECLRSLNELVYPEKKIEIIIVDDHSTDKTSEIIKSYVRDKQKFKMIVPKENLKALKGKANAIANAIKIAKGDVILTTDADCTVNPLWTKTLASYYENDVAMVCGFTNQSSLNAFHEMQSIDFIFLLSVASGTMNLGKPLSCIGNNMSYRKNVYHEVGGYENIPFSVTEDFQILMAIHKLKKYKIIYPLEMDGLVTSKPCAGAKALYWQKKRWGVGGLNSDLAGFGVMASAFLVHLGILTAPFIFTANLLYGIAFKFFIDYFFMRDIHKRLNIKMTMKGFLAFEIYYVFYVVALPILLIFDKRVKWKGREYKK